MKKQHEFGLNNKFTNGAPYGLGYQTLKHCQWSLNSDAVVVASIKRTPLEHGNFAPSLRCPY